MAFACIQDGSITMVGDQRCVSINGTLRLVTVVAGPFESEELCEAECGGGSGQPFVDGNDAEICFDSVLLTFTGGNWNGDGSDNVTVTDADGDPIAVTFFSGDAGIMTYLIDSPPIPVEGSVTVEVETDGLFSGPKVIATAVSGCVACGSGSTVWTDAFTGTGDLTAHTPDTTPGGGYSTLSYAEELTLNGSGRLTITDVGAAGVTFDPELTASRASIKFVWNLSSGGSPLGPGVLLSPRGGSANGVAVTVGSNGTLSVAVGGWYIASGDLGLEDETEYELVVENTSNSVRASITGIAESELAVHSEDSYGDTTWELIGSLVVGHVAADLDFDDLDVEGCA